MDTTQTLPPNYRLAAAISMKDNRLLFKLNVAGFFLLIVFGWLFSAAAFWLRPDVAAASLILDLGDAGGLRTILVVLLITFVTIVLHEGIHGLAFIVFGKVRPTFGFRWIYAFAAAPGNFIPRDRYLPVALAPLVVLSLVGVALMAVVPAQWLTAILLACVVNASGSVADLWVAWLLLRLPAEALASDLGEKIELYLPEGVILTDDIC